MLKSTYIYILYPQITESLENFPYCVMLHILSTVSLALFYLQSIADTLMDALDAIESVRTSKTLQRVLGAILAIGNFLNNTKV